MVKHHYIDLRCMLDLTTPALRMLGLKLDMAQHRIRVLDTYEYIDAHTIDDFIYRYLDHVIEQSVINDDLREYIDYALIHVSGLDMESSETNKHIFHVNKLSLDDKLVDVFSTVLSNKFGVNIVLDNYSPLLDFNKFDSFIVYNGLELMDFLSINGDFVKDSVSDKIMFTPLFIEEVHSGADIVSLMDELKSSLKTIVNIEFMPVEIITEKESTTPAT